MIKRLIFLIIVSRSKILLITKYFRRNPIHLLKETAKYALGRKTQPITDLFDAQGTVL